MKVKDIMTRRTVKMLPSTPILEVSQKMKDLHTEALPVCEEDRFLGFVWDHDIVCGLVAGGSSPKRMCTRSLLRQQELSVSPDSELIQAAVVMAEHSLRLLPVLERGRLVGLLSLEDIAGASEVFAGAILSATARAKNVAQLA